VECDGLGYLFLAFDPLIEEPGGENVLPATDAGLKANTPDVQTAALQAAIDRVSEDENLDTLLIPAGFYRGGDLHLKSHCRIHLASGAVLKASDKAADFKELDTQGSDGTRHCLISGRDAENISLTGHGHIDGNRAVLDLERYFNGMVKLDRCRGVTFDGVVLSDSCGWNTHFYACTDVLAHRVKILNNRPLVNCINTDGINPNACRNVRIQHCLMHTGDDAVAVKSCTWRRDMHPGHEQMLQDVSDITVSDLLAVNNSTTAKIGTETDAAVMENMTFQRIDAVRTARLCAIDAFDNSLVRNVRFEDCHVHHLDDAMMDRRLIDLHAPAQEDAFRKIIGKSRIEGVTLKNISSDEPARVVLIGRNAETRVENVTFDGVTICGKPLSAEEAEANAFVGPIKVLGQ
jgi:polygalacturonase